MKRRAERILHGPSSVGGLAATLARAQRDLGADATSVHYAASPYGIRADEELDLAGRGRAGGSLTAARFALRAISRYDVFHLYFGHTLLPHLHPDVPLLRALGKRIVFHFCGCDIRNRSLTLAHYQLSGCTECTSLVCLRMRAPRAAAADAVFVATPDLLEFVPEARLMPVPIDLEAWSFRPRKTCSPGDPVRIVHAPTDPDIKGTRHLVEAVSRLRDGGHRVELDLIQNVPASEVLQRARSAHLAVDQLMIGAYGAFAVEMMALGLPVVCRIRSDLRLQYPADLPLVDADPATIYEVLDRLLGEPEAWPELGRRGAEYARREHEMHVVAERVLDVYRSMNSRNQSSRQTRPQSARP
jgi:glycosyltransferase involved in cell wall biosynthesis